MDILLIIIGFFIAVYFGREAITMLGWIVTGLINLATRLVYKIKGKGQ